MQIKKVDPQLKDNFKPITFEITCETLRELEILRGITGCQEPNKILSNMHQFNKNIHKDYTVSEIGKVTSSIFGVLVKEHDAIKRKM